MQVEYLLAAALYFDVLALANGSALRITADEHYFYGYDELKSS